MGTLSVGMTVAGDAGGGSIFLGLSMTGRELGFPFIWTPTLIAAHDNLASAIDVRLQYLTPIDRLELQLERRISMANAGGTANQGQIEGSFLPVSVVLDNVIAQTVLQAVWATNTDGKAYNLNLFGVVYDEQAMARESELEVTGPLAGPL